MLSQAAWSQNNQKQNLIGCGSMQLSSALIGSFMIASSFICLE
jgi:hypothetical protein